MQAKVTSGLVDAHTYLATVECVDRVADAASGTYGARLSPPNPDYKISAGLRCKLTSSRCKRQRPTILCAARHRARGREGRRTTTAGASVPKPVLTLWSASRDAAGGR
jgi:hypothetical protein